MDFFDKNVLIFFRISKRKQGLESATPNPSQILRHHLRPCCHEYITTFESLREDVYLEVIYKIINLRTFIGFQSNQFFNDFWSVSDHVLYLRIS